MYYNRYLLQENLIRAFRQGIALNNSSNIKRAKVSLATIVKSSIMDDLDTINKVLIYTQQQLNSIVVQIYVISAFS